MVLPVVDEHNRRRNPAIAADEAEILRRAKLIKFRAKIGRLARAAFIPSVTLYSLFLLRPREGHFIRHIAERRYFDPSFDTLFVDHSQKRNAAQESSKRSGFFSRLCLSSPSVQQHHESDIALKKEARRRAMFVREETAEGPIAQTAAVLAPVAAAKYTATIRDGIHSSAELTESKSKNMADLVEELEEMSERKRQEKVAAGLSPQQLPNHVAAIIFSEHTFYASARIDFRRKPDGPVELSKSYVGVWGTIWKELA